MIDQVLSHFLVGVAQADFTLGLPFSSSTKTYTTFGAYFTGLVGFAVIIATSIATLIIVYAGILYSRSQGQPQPIAQAKELVAGSLTGLAILLLIRLILPTLGIDAK